MTDNAQQPAVDPNNPWVWMVRMHLRDIPQSALPEKCAIRGMRPDDAGLWTDIERDAENAPVIGPEVFYREFGEDPAAWPTRCLLVNNERGIAVGTLSAWYARDFLGQEWGRIHWFAIRPSHQGRGLARPLLSHAMNLLAQWHVRAYLVTSIERLRAIKLYLDYGFVPLLRNEQDRYNWQRFRQTLEHPGLDQPVTAEGTAG